MAVIIVNTTDYADDLPAMGDSRHQVGGAGVYIHTGLSLLCAVLASARHCDLRCAV